MRSLLTSLVLALAGLLLTPTTAFAKFPDGRLVTIVVPFPPGGSTDSSARLLAEKVSQIIGAPVAVENRPGGATMIGMSRVMQARPDGLTLFYAGTSGILNPHLRSDAKVTLMKDMKPVSLVGTASLVMVVRNDHPAKTLADLVALAKAKPGDVQVGIPALGSANHIAIERFVKQAGVNLQYIPFPGNAQNVQGLLSGLISVGVEAYISTIAHIQSGTLRPLAVTSRERWRALPQVPTVEESGYPGYETIFFVGIYAPKDTPSDIVDILADAFDRALKDTEINKKMDDLGFVAVGGKAEVMEKFARDQDAYWGRFLKDNKIKLE